MRQLLKANAGLLAAGIATFMLMGAGQALLGPALPVFARDFGLSDGTAGLVVSAFWIGCAIAVGGMYLRGRRITPRHGLAVIALGAALMAAGLGWWGTLLGAAVFGAGYGTCTVVFNPRVLKAFGGHGTAMLSLLNATFGLGAIASPLAFLALGQSPTLAFGACAIAAALIWLAAGPAGRTGAASDTQGPLSPFRPRFGFLLFAVFGIGLEAALIGLGPTALIAAGEPEARAAALLSGFFAAFLGARVLLVFTAHLIDPFRLYTGAMAGAAVLALVAALSSPALGFVALGFCAALFFPSFYVAATRLMGDDPRVAPLIIAAGLVGGIFGPVLLGSVMGHLGERGFFWLALGIAVPVTLAALATLRRMPVPHPA